MRVNELFEVSLGDYARKAAMDKAKSQMGAALGSGPEERQRSQQRAARRTTGLARAGQRTAKAQSAARDQNVAKLRAQLPQMRQNLENMEKRYAALGGSNWQYADREQNLTPGERDARDLEHQIQHLRQTISSLQN